VHACSILIGIYKTAHLQPLAGTDALAWRHQRCCCSCCGGGGDQLITGQTSLHLASQHGRKRWLVNTDSESDVDSLLPASINNSVLLPTATATDWA